MIGAPMLFGPVGTSGILATCGGHRHKMAARGRAKHKMAAMAFVQSHSGEPCVVVAAKQRF